MEIKTPSISNSSKLFSGMFFLAIRHLLSRRRQTLLTTLGILLGTATYVVFTGMMLGFQTFIVDQLLNNDSHIRISGREEMITERSLDRDLFGTTTPLWISPPIGRRDNPYILNPGGWLTKLEQDPRVLAHSPQMVTQVIASHGRIKLAGRLIGSEVHRQSQVTNIEKHMIIGRFREIGTSGSRVVIGEGLRRRLGLSIPSTISLTSGTGETQSFKVIGSFNLGIKSLDDSTLFGSLFDVQRLNGTPNRISDIAIKLHDVTLATEMASEWGFHSNEKVQSWEQANEGIMSVFKTQDIVRNTISIAIILVAGFGIYNVLSMTINQKRRDIAILRSIGFLPKDILTLFMLQGLILGFWGGVLGCGFGYLACLLLEMIPVSSDRMMGGGTMMIVYFPSIYVSGFLLAFLSSCLASLLPAREAGRMTPIHIIRGEAT